MNKPTKADLQQAYGKYIPDVLGPGIRLLFCGINPGLYSAYIGHHFGKPGNRFWKVIHQAGFTPRLFTPYEDRLLLELGYGLTNLVERATANATELNKGELRQGAKTLEEKVRQYKIQTVAILGIGAYRKGFHQPEANWGKQTEKLDDAVLWVLPNPSGLNAHFQIPELVRIYRQLLPID